MNKFSLILLGLLFVCVGIPMATAFSTTTFNNSLSSEVLFYPTPNNFIRYLPIPQGTLVTSNFMTLTYPTFISNSGLSKLTAYYNLDEPSGTNARDDVLGLHNGTVVGNVQLNQPGLIGKAFNFTRDGINNGFLNITNHTGDCADKNCTIAVWINNTASGTQIIFSEGVSSTGPFIATGINFLSGGTPAIRLKDVGGVSQDIHVPTGPHIVSQRNYWQQLVFAMNTTSAMIFINGTLINQTAITVGSLSGAYKTTRIGSDLLGGFGDYMGEMDEIGMWNSTLTPAEVSTLYNNGAGYNLSNFYPGGNTIGGLNLTIGSSLVQSFDIGNGTTNASLNINNLNSVLNSYVSTCTIVAGFCNVPFNFSSDVAGSFIEYSNLNFSNTGFTENNQTWRGNTTSGNREYFTINVTYDTSYYTSVTPYLVYNNTQYSPSSTTASAHDFIFNATLIAPVTATQILKTFYWSFALTNTTGAVTYINSTVYNQTISPFSIDDCSSNTQQILNFTLFDEDSRENVNGTIETLTNIYTYGTTNLVATANQSKAYTIKAPARVCIATLPAGVVYSGSYETKYYGNQTAGPSQYAVEYKFSQNFTISSATAMQDIALYDLLDSRSTDFSITLQNPDLSTVQGAVIDIQRQYVPLNQFISVESPLTDTYGAAIAHLLTTQTYYNFVVTKQGQLLGTFNNYQVQCQNQVTGDCRITLNLVQSSGNLPDFTNYGNISTNVSLNRAARTVYFNFVTTNGNSHDVAWNVTLLNNYGNTTICASAQSGTSGSFSCVIPTTYGNTSVAADLYSDRVYLGRNVFSLQPASEDIFGGTRVVIGLVMYSMLALLMVASPPLIIIGSILGMALAVAFHVVDSGTVVGNSLIITWFVIAGAIILFHMRDKT